MSLHWKWVGAVMEFARIMLSQNARSICGRISSAI